MTGGKPEGSSDAPKDGESADAGKEGAKEESAPVVPEKYEFAVPEGVTLDTDVVADLEGFARTHKLSQESAQAIADMGVKLSMKWAEDVAAKHVAAVQEWAGKLPSDPEFGGDAYKENLGLVRQGTDHCFTTEGKKFLQESGLGNHPELVRSMYRVGLLLREDVLPKKDVDGGGTNGSQKQKSLEEVAERMYPSSKQKG